MRVLILGSGTEIVGGGVRSLYSVVEEMIKGSQREILIASYAVSGSLENLFSLLRASAERGVRVRIIVNRLEEKPPNVRSALDDLMLGGRGRVEIFSFQDRTGRSMHIKAYSVDSDRVVLGSANLTWKGLVENLELGVYLEGRPAELVTERLYRLIALSTPYRVRG